MTPMCAKGASWRKGAYKLQKRYRQITAENSNLTINKHSNRFPRISRYGIKVLHNTSEDFENVANARLSLGWSILHTSGKTRQLIPFSLALLKAREISEKLTSQMISNSILEVGSENCALN
ncbi:predicted protein [Sclerotinia sclerotiorum 1980 UF-70]|uniref:Uncharacterized protein n=1 Tax=Sclerotinia sclerotiorum (strain ATCC 18683 / 1980 / Ss-1) TaxID=665079 RepID=A7F3S0_SCLS1|nr:predicted protein [Sclerotinia sclerotiorum 1980 UF-70]EDN97391.1 predicted protein [Sclerotinia sclerotiorum 1980 UF-70]